MSNRAIIAVLMGASLLLACSDQGNAPQATESAQPPAAASPLEAAPAQPSLQDVIQTTPTHVVGISYPKDFDAPPGLARVMLDYAEQARAGLIQALDELGNDKPRVPYELSLSFTVTADTPQLLAVSADGSRYTGGAHGEPLLARFVWLRQAQTLLTSDVLITDPAGRAIVAGYAEDALIAQMEARLQAEKLDGNELSSARAQASEMIRDGTQPDAGNFRQFQPVLSADGRIAALRFVFPPYQVGPYSDGTQSVDVPANILLPHVAPAYVALFDPS